MNIALALQGIVGILWLGVLGLVVITVIRASRGVKVGRMTISIAILAAAALAMTAVSQGLVFIQPEERGVVISALQPKGYREQALQPGLHWIIPYLEDVIRYPISRQTYTMSIAPAEGQVVGDDSVMGRTADGQQVQLDASVIYQIDPEQVVKLHIEWQRRYTDELVRPQSRGIMRDAVAKYKVEEVYSTKRDELTTEITDRLRQKFADNGLELVDFVLRNITFSDEYAKSVEQKQIAEQQAQQAKLVVEQKKQEAQQAIETARGQAESVKIKAQGDADARVIQAKAEAEALQLIADALKSNPNLLTYQYINKLAPGVQVMLLPSNTPYILPLNSLGPATTTSATPTTTP